MPSLDEARRLEVLRTFAIMDSPAEEAFDELAALAAQVCETPVAFISFVDARREWFKSCAGFVMTEARREISLGAHAIQSAEPFVIIDAACDDRFIGNPLVANGPLIRFYAAAPIVTGEGAAVGAIGVFNCVPGELSAGQRHALSVLSRQVVAQLELRSHARKWQASLAERKQTEAILRAEQEKLRAILNAAPECVKLLDPDGTLREINPAGLQIVEAERLEQVIGHSLLPLVVPDDRETIREMLELATEGGKHIREFRIVGLKGTPRWMEVTAVPLRDELLGKDMVLAVSHDISERKRAEENLRESEMCFRQVVENIREVFWMTDTEKKHVLYISPRYAEIWGRTCESLIASPGSWMESIHPDDRDRVEKAWKTHHAVGEYHQEYRIIRPEGSERWVRDRGFPVRDASGVVYRVAGVAEDITDHKRLEEQFHQSQKMEAIGQLASGVAHDFNNLLTVIQGNASLLMEDLHGDAKISVQEIVQASERASGLTRQLLLFSRKQAMQTVNLDLNEIVGNTTRMLQRILGEDIALRANYGPGLPLIRADAGMIEQILLNLAVNSRDAMPRGGRLEISTATETLNESEIKEGVEAAPGLYACLRVSDTGSGIPPDILPRIFEPFFSTKEIGKGTGLGLATVYAIVRQHRGWIAVNSSHGIGTTFRIYLPASDGPRAGRKTEGRLDKLPGGNETILVVEDEPSLRILATHLLQRCGYSVLVAASGKAALEVWKEGRNRITLLLTDMVMPDGVTGRELAEKLQAEKPELKVIFTSGYNSETVGKGSVLVDGVNFLQKPYDARKLAETIRDCLDRK